MTIRRRVIGALLAGLLLSAAAAGCGRDHDADRNGTAHIDISAAPATAKWQSYRGVYVPTTQAGPAETGGPVPVKYQQNPQGAVVAAMQAQARLSLAPDDAWNKVANTLVVAGPGRDAFATARVFASITTETDPAQTAQFQGFRIDGWTPEAVTVWLATRMPTGELSAQPSRMLWRSGDWKLELPAGQKADEQGRVPTDPVALTNLDGYTEFHR
ncbi:hypothetical protein [Nocardia sp. NPDC004860]|uniref:hypothetical protein n=1 Tax=Nocardia sp. NPDC004860 TaxID=3154557 RepID=UPI0033B24F04